jgi:hypothetical protein
MSARRLLEGYTLHVEALRFSKTGRLPRFLGSDPAMRTSHLLP